jgi:hypothetical protein
MTIAAIKKLLTETVGADEAAKVVESLETFQKQTKADAEKGVKALVEEQVKAEKIRLEAKSLAKLEEAKAAGDKTIKEEIAKYERQLAERVKALLVQAIDSHGDRLARISEQTEAKRGSALLEEVEKLIAKGKSEITEATKVDPKEVAKLKAEVATLKESEAKLKKDALEQKARANVAEQSVKELRESLETSLQVSVTETEETKGKPAGEDKGDKKTIIKEDGSEDGADKGKGGEFSPEMARMRKLAGIKS